MINTVLAFKDIYSLHNQLSIYVGVCYCRIRQLPIDIVGEGDGGVSVGVFVLMQT